MENVQATTPWDDCKVAFDIFIHDEAIWRAAKSWTLPRGWELNGTEMNGACGYVAVFRIVGLPAIADGETVKSLLNGAIAKAEGR